jgi:hypothetical protein
MNPKSFFRSDTLTDQCRGNEIDPGALTQLVNGIFLTPGVVATA